MSLWVLKRNGLFESSEYVAMLVLRADSALAAIESSRLSLCLNSTRHGVGAVQRIFDMRAHIFRLLMKPLVATLRELHSVCFLSACAQTVGCLQACIFSLLSQYPSKTHKINRHKTQPAIRNSRCRTLIGYGSISCIQDIFQRKSILPQVRRGFSARTDCFFGQARLASTCWCRVSFADATH